MNRIPRRMLAALLFAADGRLDVRLRRRLMLAVVGQNLFDPTQRSMPEWAQS